MRCFIALLICFLSTFYCAYCIESNSKLKKSSEVEVRSVFLNCELKNIDEMHVDSDVTRFQREELFKHNSLRNCKNKLAVTINMCNDPEQPPADEYIPIEHVLGAQNKRIRLLNPYILRLRREAPHQIYKLQKIDTVMGVFSSSHEGNENIQVKGEIFKKHAKRDDYPYESLDKFYDNLYVNDDKRAFIQKSRVDAHVEQNDMYRGIEEFSTHSNLINVPRMYHQFNTASSLNYTMTSDRAEDTTLYRNNNQFSKRDDFASSYMDFVLYEIGEPDLWHTAQVQLYEKISTPEGKTMWNDFTKLLPVSVSAMDPNWSNQDITIRYRAKDFMAREDFNLPAGGFCLVLPLSFDQDNLLKNNKNIAMYGEFIIVPLDDVIMIQPDKLNQRSNENKNSSNESVKSENNQRRRRVVIRTTRKIMVGSLSNLDILKHGSERYLMLPHRTPHRTQLDVEAKADDNKLIVVGASGRLTSIVSDTRKTRCTLNLKVTNTGLAAAHYRVSIRECNPRLTELHENELISTKALIPPKHTKLFQIDLPLDNTFTNTLCSVSLINDEDESVAVRDVTIKSNDRCFCIWHCDCICLSEDPKLICRNMPEAQLVAAGLSRQEGPRHIRSVCYPDLVTLNIFVIFFGVLLSLLTLGVLKALLGLCLPCMGLWGLHLLLNIPRKLDHYYESSLRCRTVVYDRDGWPVHPHTKQRTVRLVSRSMEFFLNVIYFIILPCVLLWDVLKELTNKCKSNDVSATNNPRNGIKKCFSTQDMQSKEIRWRRHKGGLHRWMTPQAEDLSTNIWQYGLPAGGKIHNYMQPLLNDIPFHGKSEKQAGNQVDSEQDDTEFVLMQMQKSKESLSKSQQILKKS